MAQQTGMGVSSLFWAARLVEIAPGSEQDGWGQTGPRMLGI